ncbi:Fur family transcriptional regulator [Mucilaginibacter defluvii]|uniref:Fur family transcriptional regulator n=1 Tax=Mucilaginibacter defluvii TaxID=1196019 RepID=UPI0031EBC556
MIKRRSTPTKEAVLEVLKNTGKAMSKDAIEQQIQVDIDRATIYRVLNRFCEDGTLHKIIAEGGKQYFALCIKCKDTDQVRHHFHFRCNCCKTIECLPNSVHFTVPEGYEVEDVNCILSGVCKACAVQK